MRNPDLFLLHFAGGNVYSFNFLEPYLDDEFNFVPIELPGRGNRMEEKLLFDKKKAIDDIVEQILKKLKSERFIIYGHSMGANLGFSVIIQLEKLGKKPLGFIVTGNSGPNITTGKRTYLLPKKEFIKELQSLGGISNKIIENEEVFDFLEPMLRADFELIERKENEVKNIKINCPIYVCMGEGEINSDKIESWRFYTKRNVITRLFPGGHFFINNYPLEISEIIKSMITNI